MCWEWWIQRALFGELVLKCVVNLSSQMCLAYRSTFFHFFFMLWNSKAWPNFQLWSSNLFPSFNLLFFSNFRTVRWLINWSGFLVPNLFTDLRSWMQITIQLNVGRNRAHMNVELTISMTTAVDMGVMLRCLDIHFQCSYLYLSFSLQLCVLMNFIISLIFFSFSFLCWLWKGNQWTIKSDSILIHLVWRRSKKCIKKAVGTWAAALHGSGRR